MEGAILRELEPFVLELGKGFAFVERQKRMIIDGEDFYLDLLFFHRKLKRLVAIELKPDKFKAADKGQMELLELGKDGIMVAEYWTALPPKSELEAKLHQALIEAKARMATKSIPD